MQISGTIIISTGFCIDFGFRVHANLMFIYFSGDPHLHFFLKQTNNLSFFFHFLHFPLQPKSIVSSCISLSLPLSRLTLADLVGDGDVIVFVL